MMEATLSSDMSIVTRATGPHSPEDGVLHGHRREYLKSYSPVTSPQHPLHGPDYSFIRREQI
jgi:hypothetical protein